MIIKHVSCGIENMDVFELMKQSESKFGRDATNTVSDSNSREVASRNLFPLIDKEHIALPNKLPQRQHVAAPDLEDSMMLKVPSFPDLHMFSQGFGDEDTLLDESTDDLFHTILSELAQPQPLRKNSLSIEPLASTPVDTPATQTHAMHRTPQPNAMHHPQSPTSVTRSIDALPPTPQPTTKRTFTESFSDARSTPQTKFAKVEEPRHAEIKCTRQQCLRTLFNTYWDAKGRIPVSRRRISIADFKAAKSCGVMFDPVEFTHETLMTRIRNLQDTIKRQGITKTQVANAFIMSLSTRNLELRSALASFAFIQHFPTDHKCVTHLKHGSGKEYECQICRWECHYDKERACMVSLNDLNELNFERHKWGGIRRLDPVYCMFDLEMLIKELGHEQLVSMEPTEEGVKILSAIVAQFRCSSSSMTASRIHKTFKADIRSNKAERDMIVATFGVLDILKVDSYGAQGFERSFKAFTTRAKPSRRFVDMEYPACWWKGSDGLNEDILMTYFGHCL